MRWWVFVVALLVPAIAHAIPPGPDGQRLLRAAQAIRELRIEEAEPELRALAAAYEDDADVRWQEGVMLFHRGDYRGAQRAMDRALELVATSGDGDDRRELRDIVAATATATAGYVETRSRDGRYAVFHAPGRDRVLVPYALEALAAADDAISHELGVRVPGPIRLEIYPAPAALSRVSTLSVADIERTGTIALCKWDRLMITSPHALVRGYPWVDTIGHELVHLILARGTRDRAPVWLHEGIAKMLERTWRGEPPEAHLDPPSEGLLADALRESRLIPFEQLHPSIARLPSQRDAALAFAQVATFFETLRFRHGSDVLSRTVPRLAAGEDARDALHETAGVPFATLEREWREALALRPRREDAPPLLAMRFRHGEGEVDETSEVSVEPARRFMRLGDLLWGRGRARAAAHEYGRAHQLAPSDPILTSRLARAALAGGDPGRAASVLEGLVQAYPDHAPGRAVLGSALLALGQRDRAIAELEEAIRLNPFDPQPHCDLAEAYQDGATRDRERTACHELGTTE